MWYRNFQEMNPNMFTVHLVGLEKEKRERFRVCVHAQHKNKNTKVYETKGVLLAISDASMYTLNLKARDCGIIVKKY